MPWQCAGSCVHGCGWVGCPVCMSHLCLAPRVVLLTGASGYMVLVGWPGRCSVVVAAVATFFRCSFSECGVQLSYTSHPGYSPLGGAPCRCSDDVSKGKTIPGSLYFVWSVAMFRLFIVTSAQLRSRCDVWLAVKASLQTVHHVLHAASESGS